MARRAAGAWTGDGEDGERGGICESVRWVESYEYIAQHARELPQTRLVCVGDRESDMLELMVRARELGHPADYLVRCQHNRVLPGQGGKLWAAVAQGELLGEVCFEMPRGRGRQARKVTQEIRAKRISLSDGHAGRRGLRAGRVACRIHPEQEAHPQAESRAEHGRAADRTARRLPRSQRRRRARGAHSLAKHARDCRLC